MKIYLGGKMSGHDDGDNWRLPIVSGEASEWPKWGNEYEEVWGAVFNAVCGDGAPPESWPVLPKAIFDKHDYVGPYLARCDHGCYHTGDHATSIDRGEHSDDESTFFRNSNRQQIVSLCIDAMTAADVLFFWIDSLDAYGTLAELVHIAAIVGMANAMDDLANEPRSINKHIFIATPDLNAIDEMWLALRLVQHVAKVIVAPTPKDALTQALATLEVAPEYSPIEKMFIEKWQTIYGNGIVPQYNVPGFRYRVDFAFPDEKMAVELDGYEYHNSKEQFTNDRKRQREMESKGWRFIRFSGSEVYNNAAACVQQTYEFWQSLTQAKA